MIPELAGNQPAQPNETTPSGIAETFDADNPLAEPLDPPDLPAKPVLAANHHHHFQRQLCLQSSSSATLNATPVDSPSSANHNHNDYYDDNNCDDSTSNLSTGAGIDDALNHLLLLAAQNDPAQFAEFRSADNKSLSSLSTLTTQLESNLNAPPTTPAAATELDHRKGSVVSRSSSRRSHSNIVIRKFQKLDESLLSSTPAPDVKIGQRVAYKEYYGNEFGTIRWIGKLRSFVAHPNSDRSQ